VTVVREPYALNVVSEGTGVTANLLGSGSRFDRSHSDLNFMDFPGLLGRVATALMQDWTPPGGNVREGREERIESPEERNHWRHWAVNRTAWAINKIVYHEWKRLLATADPTVLAVHKSVFAATFGYRGSSLVKWSDLYKHKFIVQDVIAHRAAAIAAYYCGRLDDLDEAIDLMSDWKAIYSPTGKSYPILNRTLMNLPGGIPPRLLIRLAEFMLPRPIYNRVELIATIHANLYCDVNRIRLLSFARGDQIKEAMTRIFRHLHRDLSPRRSRHVQDAMQFLADFPDDHRGNIIGLTEKAIRWHRDGRAEMVARSIARYGEQSATAMPPVPLPTESGIRFLGTVGEVCQESKEMEHCIASYASKAVQGRSFLFHVDYEGERASIEIDWLGNVIQTQGPKNSKNAACDWGGRVLGKWGRGLRTRQLAGE